METDFIRALPKAELHVHLEGSITPETLLALAQRNGMERSLPSTDPAALQEWFTFTDFPHFIEIYLTICDCIRTADDFTYIVEAFARAAAAQSIIYAEVTTTPYIHTHLQKKGLSIDAILRGLDAGRKLAASRYGVQVHWIFDIPRNVSFDPKTGAYDPAPANITLDHAVRGKPYGVIGFGLGGDEVEAPPAPFAHAFLSAQAHGLVSVPHAGETEGPASVWGSLQSLRAQRIGHGVRSMEDPALLSILAATQTPLEVNLSSNVCLHVYPSLDRHPFPHLDAMGLLVTVNSDDPPLFNTTLVAEYTLLQTAFGYGDQDVARIARNAFRASAQPHDVKRTLLERFDQWVASNLPT